MSFWMKPSMMKGAAVNTPIDLVKEALDAAIETSNAYSLSGVAMIATLK